ncbi:MAG: hypothetical protein K0S28_408 [Paucimonas sp.]|jgi:hypothetical protein|nr:hypothetical protein [Paucimonas sp.]
MAFLFNLKPYKRAFFPIRIASCIMATGLLAGCVDGAKSVREAGDLRKVPIGATRQAAQTDSMAPTTSRPAEAAKPVASFPPDAASNKDVTGPNAINKLRQRVAQLNRERQRTWKKYLRMSRKAARGIVTEHELEAVRWRMDLIHSELNDAREQLHWHESARIEFAKR